MFEIWFHIQYGPILYIPSFHISLVYLLFPEFDKQFLGGTSLLPVISKIVLSLDGIEYLGNSILYTSAVLPKKLHKKWESHVGLHLSQWKADFHLNFLKL